MSASLRLVTLNIHKGLSQFNRRMVIHELREGLNALEPDLVFLQEVQGLNARHALRFASWPSAPQHEYLKQDGWEYAYGLNRVHHSGHHGNAVLSRFPMDLEAARTFQKLRWADLPGATGPLDPDTGKPWYAKELWQQLRLSLRRVDCPSCCLLVMRWLPLLRGMGGDCHKCCEYCCCRGNGCGDRG